MVIPKKTLMIVKVTTVMTLAVMILAVMTVTVIMLTSLDTDYSLTKHGKALMIRADGTLVSTKEAVQIWQRHQLNKA